MKHRFVGNEGLQTGKQLLRQRCLRSRHQQADKQSCSRQIGNWLGTLPEYQTANTVSMYVSTPPEVQTLKLIDTAWSDNKKVAVPYCLGNRLEMFHLKSMEELAPRTLGILEPRPDLRQRDWRWLEVSQIELFIVPGVAFDRSGGRLGYGKGYYDRLLAGTQRGVIKIALAFQCQVVDRVPMLANDVFMDILITESTIYRCHQFT